MGTLPGHAEYIESWADQYFFYCNPIKTSKMIMVTILLISFTHALASTEHNTCGYLKSAYLNAIVEGDTGQSGCCGKASDALVAPDIDITGYGYCDAHSINMTVGWRWTQYPSPLKISRTLGVNQGFTGKNAIVWSPDGFEMFGFVIGKITNNTLIEVTGIKNETDGDVPELPKGMCRFTLDAFRCGKYDQNWCTSCISGRCF